MISNPAIAHIPSIVSAACLAHDIGNPPFGHSGEYAIQSWAENNRHLLDGLSLQEQQDFLEFEGNAQAFRVVASLQVRRRVGGLQLTHATIGAMMKYPSASLHGEKPRQALVGQKKFGFFAAEEHLAVAALKEMGLPKHANVAYARHPLAFLVEAADDICYRIVDLEDSVDQGLVGAQAAIEVLRPLARAVSGFRDKTYRPMERVTWLRAHAINGLIEACHDVFVNHIDAILDGTFNDSLIQASGVAKDYNALEELVQEFAYSNDRVLKVEVAGFQTIGGLLDKFVGALLEKSPDKEQAKVRALMPLGYLQRPGKKTISDRNTAIRRLTPYERILAATDFVSGMTDSYAIELYRNLTGIKLPM